jgi:tRNA-specific 2-thiouridylase
MSGGVDSSLSALLLKEQGYRVIGLFMRNWEDLDGSCQAVKDQEDVARVADQLQIPFYTVNMVEAYRNQVFKEFLDDLQKGLTPNPDILCNKRIKFKAFFDKAIELGADFLATGHYAQVGEGGCLKKGRDPGKDQSYFLHAIEGNVLPRVLFPVGGLVKEEVRRLARQANLATAEKKDSTGICFVGKRDFKPFIGQYLGFQKGPLCRLDGTVVGEHDGAVFYTIGQRKGIGLGGEGEAWFVVAKEIESNRVYVERGENHPALYSSELIATDLTWIQAPPLSPRCQAKIRYRQTDQPCHVEIREGLAFVRFDQAQRAITPGQAVVFYQGDLCLGGGKIARAIL